MLCNFSYVAPDNREELLEFLSQKKSSAKIIAGGTDLLVDIRSAGKAPEFLVDLKNIEEYSEINFSLENGLSIGPSVTLIQLMERGFVNSDYPLIAQAASQIGSCQLRNRATAVGNICTASPAADMSPALLALGASVELASVSGVRRVSLKDFFLGVKKTDIREDEIVESILIPSDWGGHSGSMLKMKRIKGHDLSLVSVACAAIGNRLSLAVGSAAPVPVHVGEFDYDEKVENIVERAQNLVSPIDDIRASAEYRRFMLSEYIIRLVEEVRAI